MEQIAVHIGYEPNVAAHLLDTDGKKKGITGLLDTGAVVSGMLIKTWYRISFTRNDLIPTNLRLAAANIRAIYVAGKTPILVLQMGGSNLWMSFLVVENLEDSDQFNLGRDVVTSFDEKIDLINGLIRIRNPEVTMLRIINWIVLNEDKIPIFVDRKEKLKTRQSVEAVFWDEK